LSEELDGVRVAFVVANEGVEQVELTEPRKAVESAGRISRRDAKAHAVVG